MADITVPLHEKDDGLYSFNLDLGVDGCAGKELAMNVVASAQVRHRWLDHLNKRSLELMNRQNGNNSPSQLVCGEFMSPFKPTARGGYEFVSKSTDQFTKWPIVYLLCSKDQALASLQLFVASTMMPLGKRNIV